MSVDGSYTVSWGTTLGCEEWNDPPFYSVHCYSLQENGVDVPWSGYSRQVTGKPPGWYQYQVYYRVQVYGNPYDEYPVEGPVWVQVLEPPPSLETQEYASRHGDVDGDGDIDLYVKRVAGTSWQLPIAELLLRKAANGTFNVETTVSQATRNIVDTWGISETQPTLTDVNADGHFDLLIKGLPLVNAAPWDLVVFASNGPGAPPVSTRFMDESIKKFANDAAGYFDDPTYFNNAYQWYCTIYWTTFPGYRYDIDGYQYYYYFPVPWVECYVSFDPAYSYEAAQAAPSLKRIFDAGTVEAGSYDAQVVDYYLTQLLGTAFTVTGGTVIPEDRAELEAQGMFLELLKYAMNGTPYEESAPHSYNHETIICNVSAAGCTADAVFTELLKFPVLGRAVDPNCGDLHRSQCQVPVATGDQTMVEIRESPNDDDDVGLVVHDVNQTERILVNETLPGHVFHHGTVTRRVVVEPNGDVKITTVGEGTGPFSLLNEIGGKSAFSIVDQMIKGRF